MNRETGLFFIFAFGVMVGCNKPSKVEQYRAEKHERDSVALVDQRRSLAYYEEQLALLVPQADSLMTLFQYEKNEKYQDHGFYVATGKWGNVRVMVRDDGQRDVLAYYAGKPLTVNGDRLEGKGYQMAEEDRVALERAQHLQVVMRDIKELEKRISKTSLEIQKYEKRMEKSERIED